MSIPQIKKREWVEQFFFNTGPSYDSVVRIFTLGIDGLWKKKIVEKLAHPKKVLDLACGTGILTVAIAKRFPKSEVVGVDISPGYLEVAWRKAFKHKIKNVSFVLAAAEEFTSPTAGGVPPLFDAVTASYLAKYADIPLLVRNLSSMVAPGGVLVFHDFTYPKTQFLQSCFEGYCKFIFPIGGFLFPTWKAVFHELPNVIRETKWVTELTEALKKERFRDIQVEPLTCEGSAMVSATKPS